MKRIYNRPTAQQINLQPREGVLDISKISVNSNSNTTIDGSEAYSDQSEWTEDGNYWDNVD